MPRAVGSPHCLFGDSVDLYCGSLRASVLTSRAQAMLSISRVMWVRSRCGSARDLRGETARDYAEEYAPLKPTAAAASERQQLLQALDTTAGWSSPYA